jgi:hypothetical protein
MTQRDSLDKDVRILLCDDRCLLASTRKVVDYIIAHDKALLAEIEKPLRAAKDNMTPEAYSDPYHALVHAHHRFQEALAIIAKHGGQRDGD